MRFSRKTWKDRQAEYPGRRKLTPTGTEQVYDVAREEGLILEEGDALNAANLNDLEGRVDAAVSALAQGGVLPGDRLPDRLGRAGIDR